MEPYDPEPAPPDKPALNPLDLQYAALASAIHAAEVSLAALLLKINKGLHTCNAKLEKNLKATIAELPGLISKIVDDRLTGLTLDAETILDKPAAEPPELGLHLRLRNEVDRKSLPDIVRTIAYELSTGLCGARASFPVRDDDSNVIGDWSWGYEEPLERARMAAPQGPVPSRLDFSLMNHRLDLLADRMGVVEDSLAAIRERIDAAGGERS